MDGTRTALMFLMAMTLGVPRASTFDGSVTSSSIQGQEELLLSREWVDRIPDPDGESVSYYYYSFFREREARRGFYATVTRGRIERRWFRYRIPGALYVTFEDTGEEAGTLFGVHEVRQPTHDLELEMKEDPACDGMYGKYFGRKRAKIHHSLKDLRETEGGLSPPREN